MWVGMHQRAKRSQAVKLAEVGSSLASTAPDNPNDARDVPASTTVESALAKTKSNVDPQSSSPAQGCWPPLCSFSATKRVYVVADHYNVAHNGTVQKDVILNADVLSGYNSVALGPIKEIEGNLEIGPCAGISNINLDGLKKIHGSLALLGIANATRSLPVTFTGRGLSDVYENIQVQVNSATVQYDRVCMYVIGPRLLI